jgi:hypothetical protein
MDDLSNMLVMTEPTLTWGLINEVAIDLGAKEHARAKWRQRGIPAEWRIKITQTLLARGVPVALSDFDNLSDRRLAA